MVNIVDRRGSLYKRQVFENLRQLRALLYFKGKMQYNPKYQISINDHVINNLLA